MSEEAPDRIHEPVEYIRADLYEELKESWQNARDLALRLEREVEDLRNKVPWVEIDGKLYVPNE